ncbi:MAG: hypothetical protein K2X90_04485 [Candidatus Babeliaceae bacterium]|nr:hypothetical protein [Candidatus Babeliaceae bacterium]
MNKKFLYVGLLLPFVCNAQEQELVAQAAETQENAAHEEIINNQSSEEIIDEPEDSDDQDEQDSDEEDDVSAEELDLHGSPEYARGNWYEKQQMLKQAHDVYQEVRQKEAAIAQFETTFITQKNELTNRFEEFSQSLGITLPALNKAVADELERLEALPKIAESQLAQEERIRLTQDLEKKNILIQLKKDLESITELYTAADHAMTVLMQQITSTHNFEQKAFESYEKIAQVLSDQVAKQLYAEILAARENLTSIAAYIKGDFSAYFNELAENIKKTITLVGQQLTVLQEHGLDLTKSKEKIIEKIVEVPVSNKKTSNYFNIFFSSIYNFFIGIWRFIKGFFA